MIKNDPNKHINLKKLPYPGFCGHGIIWPIVHQNSIYFIFGDDAKKIIKFNILENYHRTVRKSNIPLTQTYRPSAVRLGNKIWVMGGHQMLEESKGKIRQ